MYEFFRNKWTIMLILFILGVCFLAGFQGDDFSEGDMCFCYESGYCNP